MQKMYSDLAAWWPLLSPPEDYAEEAAFFEYLIVKAGLRPSDSFLELGSGGGSNAFHLKPLFAQVTLTDLSPQMLTISRALNPECEHLEGDMRTLRLGRTFDMVFVHDAIEYMTTLDDLGQAIETAAAHCKPGGLALFVPDVVREIFEPSTDHGGSDGEDRALRFMEWSYDPDPTDTAYTVEYVYLLRQGNQAAQVEHEQHICGLFSRAEWLGLLGKAGFQAEIVRDDEGRDIFVARKMTDFDKRQGLDKLLERKDSYTEQSLETGLEIVNSLKEDEEWKDWYWSEIAKAFSQLGKYDKAIQVATSIEHKIEKADTFLAIATDLMPTKQLDKTIMALTNAEKAAFGIEGERYEQWQRAETMGKIGKAYAIIGEHRRAQALWSEAIASAQFGQTLDNAQEIWDCSSVLSEITTYLIEAGLIDLARETAQSIRIGGRREAALSKVAAILEKPK